MFKSIARYLFGSVNDRRLKQYYSKVALINNLETEISALSDEDLKNQTNLFKERLAKGETLDDLLPEAFATVREASRRVLGKRHYDVQLIGGMILHDGMIPEMRTGEGKTLVAPLAAYLNALSEKGVHIVTVNDYLASRDAAWMGKIYEFLGLSVGCIIHGLTDEERYQAYHCDITHGTNNEFGFDYLRDNMRYSMDEMVHRPFNFAIVDEIDSILIDEARTPLIISGPTEDNSALYVKINKIIPLLIAEDYEKDEKNKSVTLTEAGTEKIEQLMLKNGLIAEGTTLYDIENVNIVHHVNQSLKAHKLFTKDVDYMIKDNNLLIIDEFTGRALEGRRYSDGLHQSLEAKENLPIQNENQTLASITFQNYFRLYPKLSGMTGTAMTEAVEFNDIYNLEVVEVPANLKVRRIDEDDEIYRTNSEKFDAIINVIIDCNKRNQPILVGTISIEKSEQLSNLLRKHNIKHSVLNAKYHDQEASIIAQAGRPGSVTIATNMAGRGTDIMLGGNAEFLIDDLPKNLTEEQLKKETAKILNQVEKDKEIVLEAGGLFVIGSERHESRRIDNQLRGRSGRQGDPGKTKFFLSLEDDLMRIFASERISSILGKLGLKDGEAIFHPMISRALEKAQAKVEARNYEIRKNLLKFDNVSNDQRKVIYEQRIEIMESKESFITLKEMSLDIAERLISSFIPTNSYPETWDIESLKHEILRIYGLDLPLTKWIDLDGIDQNKFLDLLNKEIQKLFDDKEEKFSNQLMEISSQKILLLTLDNLWKDHLLSLDHLRQGINLRAYGQKDPLNEYKREAFLIFEQMLDTLKELYVSRMSHIELSHNQGQEEIESVLPHNKTFENRFASNMSGERIARNDPCPCGSGKKYKQCHGKI